MSWLRFEDNMLDHPKWRRALRQGGDAVVAVWVRLISWCSRNLTDGLIPADMVEEVAELRGDRGRRRALEALVSSMLVARDEQGACTIVDYLQRNPSKAQVLAARAAATARKEKHRLRSAGTQESPRGKASLGRDAATTHPISIPSHIEREKDTDSKSASDECPDSSPQVTEIRETGSRWSSYPKGWHWSRATEAAAMTIGLSPEDLQEHVDFWTLRDFPGGPVRDLDGELTRSLGGIRKRVEIKRAKERVPRASQAVDQAKKPSPGRPAAEVWAEVSGGRR